VGIYSIANRTQNKEFINLPKIITVNQIVPTYVNEIQNVLQNIRYISSGSYLLRIELDREEVYTETTNIKVIRLTAICMID
jgi:hypothetical protein